MSVGEKYIVITNKLELELRRMKSEGNFKLPSETDLAARYSCSRQTIRTSLDLLKERGLIEKRKGSGSYIVDDSHKSRTVFYIAEDCDRYQSPALIRGLISELPSKFELKSFSTYGSYKAEAEMISGAIEEKAAALIIEPFRDLIPDVNERLIKEAVNLKIPVIYINSSNNPEGTYKVSPDYREAGRKLADRLKENGNKDIACIFLTDSSSGMDGYRGYIDSVYGMKDSSDDCSKCLLISSKDEKDMISGSTELLDQFADNTLTGCDAVICQNGMIAHYLSSVAEKKKLSITIACFDNGYYDSFLSAGYETGAFCRKLARSVVKLTEGMAFEEPVIPVKFFL